MSNMADQRNMDRLYSYDYEPAFDQKGLPLCLSWSIAMVENWIGNLGFPQYKVCIGFLVKCPRPRFKTSFFIPR